MPNFRVGVNDFKSMYPDLVNKYWDYNKNAVKPDEILSTSQTDKYWFICDKGHSFYKSVPALIRGVKGREGPCPICSGRQFVSGINDLETMRPELLIYWDYTKNIVKPSDVFYNSRKDKYWFKCSEGHSFQSTVHDMVRSSTRKTKGCPVCAGKVIVTGVNDFASKYPDLLKFWDYDKNDITPDMVNYKDRLKSYWFICENGHSFKSTPQNLVDRQKFRTKGCPVCSGRQVIPEINDIVTLFPDRLKEWRYDLNDVDPSTLPSNSTYEMTAVCNHPGCNNTYKVQVQYWVKGYVNNCPEHRLVLNGMSEACKGLANEIRKWGISVEEEVPLFGRYSLDIFLPDLNIAIEYNGLVWHTEERGIEYHYNKYKICKDKGIKLIYIWEDDWLYKTELIKSLLKVKLGVSNLVKINARDCTISSIGTDETREFLNKNHIQGFVSGEAYISLNYKGKTVSVIVIDGVGDSIYIKRYATSGNVRGGFSKLLNYISKTYVFDHFYTFSDNGISDGNLYKVNGFEICGHVKPDYSYLVNGRRVHKFNYRKSRFKSDSSLIYEEGLTERELADINNIPRIWDAGKIKWVKYIGER